MKSYTILRWEEPPPPRSGGGSRPTPYEQVMLELRAKPGCWAVIAEKDSESAAWNLTKALRQYQNLEVTVRNKSTVYARWKNGGDDL